MQYMIHWLLRICVSYLRMSIEEQQNVFEDKIWNLVAKFQVENYELPDANVVYVLESVKAKILDGVELDAIVSDYEWWDLKVDHNK